MEFSLLTWFLIGAIVVILAKILNLSSCLFLLPIIKRYFGAKGLTGPGGHRYITDMKKQLVKFKLEDLSCLAEAEYDKSVYFKTGGIIPHHQNEKKSLISFYGDFVCPKIPASRHNKLIGPLKAITAKNNLEVEAENNSFKLKYNKEHIATLLSHTKRILDPHNKDIGFVEIPKSEGNNALSSPDLQQKCIFLGEDEIARMTGVFFSSPENKPKLGDKPVFHSVKGNLSDFEEKLLALLVIVELYYNCVYYFEEK